MPQLVDARGNEFKGSVDIVTGEVLTDPRPISVTLGALNAETLIDLNGQSVVAIELRTAAMNATVVFEGTVDGTNYTPLTAIDYALMTMIQSVIVTTTLTKIYLVNVVGFRRFRVRISAYTSGNIVTSVRATIADFAINAILKAADLFVTATAAVNTASTATLPAAGAGLYHYITHLELVKLYAVIGVAAGAGVIITTTNLPGTPAFTTEQLASAAGTAVKVIEKSFPTPLKSLVANTATTFVAPVQLQTIWRWNVTYYVGA